MKTIRKKVCILGDFAVGKTSVIRRYVEGLFDEKYLSTIGVTISRKSLALDDAEVTLLIWDLAGGVKFSTHQSNYLRGAAGALIVCDLTRKATFTSLSSYIQDLLVINPEAAIVLLGNKIDLTQDREISDSEMSSLAENYSCPFYLTSAKSGQAVDDAFKSLVNILMLKHELSKPK